MIDRRLFLTGGLAALLACESQAGTATEFVSEPRFDTQWWLDATNHDRSTLSGLPPLAWNEYLWTYAHAHANVMADQNRLHHQDIARVLRGESGWVWAGENVGTGPLDAAEQIRAALLQSELHRDNILRSTFDSVGIGWINSGYQSWVCFVFGGRQPI